MRAVPVGIRPFVVALLLLACAASCGEGSGSEGEGSGRPTVFAAASLTAVFEELGGARFNFAGSQSLAAQVEDGAPADVIASADERISRALADAGVTGEPVRFARNRLEIVVERGNPRAIRDLEDLARDDLVVVLADPSVPVGAYSQEVLERAGVVVHPSSLELDVKAVLAKVTSGEADAGIVYVTDTDADADADPDTDGVAIREEQNVLADYHVAAVTDARDPQAASAFVRRLLAPRAQEVLRRHGFLAP